MKKIDLNCYEPFKIESEKLRKLEQRRADVEAETRQLQDEIHSSNASILSYGIDDLLSDDFAIGRQTQRDELRLSLQEKNRILQAIIAAIAEQKNLCGSLRVKATQRLAEELKPEFSEIIDKMKKHAVQLFDAIKERRKLLDELEAAGGQLSALPESFQKTSLEFSLGDPDEFNSRAHIFLKEIGA